MAKRKGRKRWDSVLSQSQRDAIDAHIRAGVLDAGEIYDQCNMVRYCKERTFRRYVRERSAVLASKSSGPDLPSSSSDCSSPTPSTSGSTSDSTIASLMERTLQSMADALVAGAVEPYVIPKFISSLNALQKFQLEEEAAKRAAELHAMKMTELRGKLKAELETPENAQKKTFTRADVADMVDRVMRGEEAV